MYFAFTISFMILLHIPIGIAQTRCHPRVARDLTPTPSDCLYAIAHILSADVHNPFDPMLSDSNPFLPIATFRHRTCIVQLKTFSIDAMPPASRTRIREHSILPMRESTLLNAWLQLRHLAEDIRTKCVESSRGGYAVGDLEGMSGGRFYAGIYGPSEEERLGPGFANYALSLKQRIMAMGEQWLRGSEELGAMDPHTAHAIAELWGSNPFAKVTYDV